MLTAIAYLTASLAIFPSYESPLPVNSSDSLKISEARCRGAVEKIKAGNADALRKIDVAECSENVLEIIEAIVSMAEKTQLKDSDAGTVSGIASSVVDPSILTGMIRLAENTSSPVSSRVASLLVLMKYYNNQSSFRGSFSDLLDNSFSCTSVVYGHSRSPKVIRPLPVDANARIAVTLETLYRDKSTPRPIRTIAQCIRSSMLKDVPTNLPNGGLTLSQGCNNSFKIINELDELFRNDSLEIRHADSVLWKALALGPSESMTFMIYNSKDREVTVWDRGKHILNLTLKKIPCESRK